MALKLLSAYVDSEEEDEEDSTTAASPISQNGAPPSTMPLQITITESVTVTSTGGNGEPGSLAGEITPDDLRKLYGFPQCIDLTAEEQVKIPDETLRPASPDLERKVVKLMEEQRIKRKTINEEIHRSKDFRNPSIYQKLIEFCAIDELGTNFAPEDFDPGRWGPSSSVEKLAEAQGVATEKFQREKKPTKVDTNKRKTKWDSGETAPKQPANLLALKMTGLAPVTRIPSSGNLSKTTK